MQDANEMKISSYGIPHVLGIAKCDQLRAVYSQDAKAKRNFRVVTSVAAAVLTAALLSGCATPGGLPGFGNDQPKPNASVVTPGVVVQATPAKVAKSSNDFSQITGGLIPAGKVPGEDVIVQITGGPLLSIPQAGAVVFTPGENVEVIHSPANGRYRIVPLTGNAAPAIAGQPPVAGVHMTTKSPFTN